MAEDRTCPPYARAAGGALLLSAVLLLAWFGALAVEDRAAVATLLILFALVTVPALLSAVFGILAAVDMLRGGRPAASVAGYAGVLAVGHVGVVALSLRPGLDRRLDGGDLTGAALGAAGTLAALATCAVAVPGRTLAVRLVAALALGVLALALLVLRAVVQLG